MIWQKTSWTDTHTNEWLKKYVASLIPIPHCSLVTPIYRLRHHPDSLSMPPGAHVDEQHCYLRNSPNTYITYSHIKIVYNPRGDCGRQIKHCACTFDLVYVNFDLKVPSCAAFDQFHTAVRGPTTLYLKCISPNPSVVLNFSCLKVTQVSSTESRLFLCLHL